MSSLSIESSISFTDFLAFQKQFGYFGEKKIFSFQTIPSGLLEKYKKVVATGNPFFKESYYGYDGINNSYRLFAAKVDDGFVVLSYDIPKPE